MLLLVVVASRLPNEWEAEGDEAVDHDHWYLLKQKKNCSRRDVTPAAAGI